METNQQPQHKVQQEKAQALKLHVCALLLWSEEKYCWYQYRQGLAYLRHTLHPDRYAYDYLERDRHFWAWWRNKYMQNDEAFVGLVHLDNLPIRQLRLQYRSLQSGQSIAAFNPMERFLLASVYQSKKLRQCKP